MCGYLFLSADIATYLIFFGSFSQSSGLVGAPNRLTRMSSIVARSPHVLFSLLPSFSKDGEKKGRWQEKTGEVGTALLMILLVGMAVGPSGVGEWDWETGSV